MNPLTILRTAFKFAPIFGALITQFTGSNIIVAVFQIAVLIRQWFAEGRQFTTVDELVLDVIDQVPEPIQHRYGAKHIKQAIGHAAKMMEALHNGKLAVRQEATANPSA